MNDHVELSLGIINTTALIVTSQFSFRHHTGLVGLRDVVAEKEQVADEQQSRSRSRRSSGRRRALFHHKTQNASNATSRSAVREHQSRLLSESFQCR